MGQQDKSCKPNNPIQFFTFSPTPYISLTESIETWFLGVVKNHSAAAFKYFALYPTPQG